MNSFKLQTNPKVTTIFDNFPERVREKLLDLRALIIETAKDMEEVSVLEETLKWGEPSYVTKKGSTLRINWKSNAPEYYAMYFQCTSKLIPTFRMVYRDTFNFEGNRALVFNLDDSLPEAALKDCIKAALRYHKVKHSPTLSM